MGTHTTLLDIANHGEKLFHENYIDESITLVHRRLAMAFHFWQSARLLVCTLKILIQFSPPFFERQC